MRIHVCTAGAKKALQGGFVAAMLQHMAAYKQGCCLMLTTTCCHMRVGGAAFSTATVAGSARAHAAPPRDLCPAEPRGGACRLHDPLVSRTPFLQLADAEVDKASIQAGYDMQTQGIDLI